jgi:transcription antitermination factor NusG
MAYWTVAQTESQREQTAAQHLERGGFEIYLPRIRHRSGKIEPLFPGYLFVQVECRWQIINATIGVLRLLTSCERPACIGDDVIAEIRSREDRSGFVRLPRRWRPQRGNQVHIACGSFANHPAIYQGASGKDRERVLLSLLGRMVSIDVPSAYLQFPSSCSDARFAVKRSGDSAVTT